MSILRIVIRHLVDVQQRLNCALSVVSLSLDFFRCRGLHGIPSRLKRLCSVGEGVAFPRGKLTASPTTMCERLKGLGLAVDLSQKILKSQAYSLRFLIFALSP